MNTSINKAVSITAALLTMAVHETMAQPCNDTRGPCKPAKMGKWSGWFTDPSSEDCVRVRSYDICETPSPGTLFMGWECLSNGGTNHELRLVGQSPQNPAPCPPPPNSQIIGADFACFKTNTGLSCYYQY